MAKPARQFGGTFKSGTAVSSTVVAWMLSIVLHAIVAYAAHGHWNSFRPAEFGTEPGGGGSPITVYAPGDLPARGEVQANLADEANSPATALTSIARTEPMVLPSLEPVPNDDNTVPVPDARPTVAVASLARRATESTRHNTPAPAIAASGEASIARHRFVGTSRVVVEGPIGSGPGSGYGTGGGSGGVGAGAGSRTGPELGHNVAPTYPPAAVEARMSGTVLLRLNIDAQGRVTAVEVARSSGHALLDRAAVDAVRKWRGRPAEQGGVPIETSAMLPVQFQLSQ